MGPKKEPIKMDIIEKNLKEFALAVGPSKQYWKEGKIDLQKVLERLESLEEVPLNSISTSGSQPLVESPKKVPLNQHYPIAWISYGGSLGKKTALIGSDFDVYLFINGSLPFSDYLTELEKVLKGNTVNLKIDGVNRSPNSIQLRLTASDINVDLVPAKNFRETPPVPEGLGKRDLLVEQHRRALATLKTETRPDVTFPKYHSSLSVFQKQFIRDLGDFTAEAVRIAKFWFSSLFIGKPSYGAATLLELVVVSTVLETGQESQFAVFLGFLSKINNMESLKIDFAENNGHWRLKPARDGTNGYIIDPSDPYQDFLKNALICPKFCRNLKRAAWITLQRLKSLRSAETLIDKMFAPLYLRFRGTGPGQKGIQVRNITEQIMGRILLYNSRHVDVAVQGNCNNLRRLEYRMTVDMIKKFLTVTVNTAVCDPENYNKHPSDVLEKACENVEKMLWAKVGGEVKNRNSASFDTCKIVITVPVPNLFLSDESPSHNIGAIKYGFSWMS